MPIATKLGRVVTYHVGLQPIKPHAGLAVSKMPHVRQLYAIKHVYIMACNSRTPKRYMACD